MTESISIACLADRPEHVSQVATWLHGQWFRESGLSRSATDQLMQSRLSASQPPMAFAACCESQVIGTASLVVDPLPTESGDAFWLTGLFVHPAWRNQGVATRLCQFVIRQAAKMNIDSLHLYTTDCQSFYQRLGWRALMETAVPNGPQLQLASLMNQAIKGVRTL